MNFWERNNFGAQNNTYNNTNNSNCNINTEADMRDKFEEYSGKSEDQLMRELSATVAKMKQNGTFDPAALDNLYSTASPFLNEEQKQRMRSLIEMFKG